MPAGPRIYPTDPEHLERLGRYIVRVPMPSKDVRLRSEGQVRVATPPDPRIGKTELMLDPLDWIHAVTQQIPASRQHLARYCGAYANRKRKAMRSAEKDGGNQAAVGTQCGAPAESQKGEEAYRRPRTSWARLLHKIFLCGSSFALACCDLCGHADGDRVECVQDQFGIHGNISADPLFRAPEGAGFLLESASSYCPDSSECA